jgi:hypothetical protein
MTDQRETLLGIAAELERKGLEVPAGLTTMVLLQERIDSQGRLSSEDTRRYLLAMDTCGVLSDEFRYLLDLEEIRW